MCTILTKEKPLLIAATVLFLLPSKFFLPSKSFSLLLHFSRLTIGETIDDPNLLQTNEIIRVCITNLMTSLSDKRSGMTNTEMNLQDYRFTLVRVKYLHIENSFMQITAYFACCLISEDLRRFALEVLWTRFRQKQRCNSV
jgi:hypothetical protein